MRKVFIIGGSGKVARRLARQPAARGHEPRSLYRKPEQADELEALGAVPVAGDLLELDADGLAIPYGDVPRDDVAATLLEIIEHPAVSRIIIELTERRGAGSESVARLAGDHRQLPTAWPNSDNSLDGYRVCHGIG